MLKSNFISPFSGFGVGGGGIDISQQPLRKDYARQRWALKIWIWIWSEEAPRLVKEREGICMLLMQKIKSVKRKWIWLFYIENERLDVREADSTSVGGRSFLIRMTVHTGTGCFEPIGWSNRGWVPNPQPKPFLQWAGGQGSVKWPLRLYYTTLPWTNIDCLLCPRCSTGGISVGYLTEPHWEYVRENAYVQYFHLTDNKITVVSLLFWLSFLF